MQDAIRIIKRAPEITMSVDSVVYRGLNHIRRNVGKHTSMYIGSSAQDRVVDICCGESISICIADGHGDSDAFDEGASYGDAFEDSDLATSLESRTAKCLYLDTSYPVSLIINGGETLLKVTKHLFLDHPVTSLVIKNEGTSSARVFLAWLV